MSQSIQQDGTLGPFADAGNVGNRATDAQIVSASDIETTTGYGQAPHKGFFETAFGRGLGTTLGRFGDGLKETFIGESLVLGGLFSSAGFLITYPVLRPLLGRQQYISLFGRSLQIAETGLGVMGAGVQRTASGFTGGLLIPLPADPQVSPPRF